MFGFPQPLCLTLKTSLTPISKGQWQCPSFTKRNLTQNTRLRFGEHSYSLSFDSHVDNIIRTAILHLRDFAKLRNIAVLHKTETFLFWTFVIFCCLMVQYITNLQLMQNAAASLYWYQFDHIAILSTLHWHWSYPYLTDTTLTPSKVSLCMTIYYNQPLNH